VIWLLPSCDCSLLFAISAESSMSIPKSKLSLLFSGNADTSGWSWGYGGGLGIFEHKDAAVTNDRRNDCVRDMGPGSWSENWGSEGEGGGSDREGSDSDVVEPGMSDEGMSSKTAG